MKRRLGNTQLNMTVAQVFPQAASYPFVELECYPVKESQTDEQRAGFHLLLQKWLEMDPGVAKNAEALKTKVLCGKFGVAFVTDQYGNTATIPLRRTTVEWSWENAGYRRKKLSKRLYAELIDYVYDMASLDDIALPILEKGVRYENKSS